MRGAIERFCLHGCAWKGELCLLCMVRQYPLFPPSPQKYAYAYARACTHGICTSIHTCSHTFTHVHTYIHTRAHIHTHITTRVHMYTPNSPHNSQACTTSVASSLLLSRWPLRWRSTFQTLRFVYAAARLRLCAFGCACCCCWGPSRVTHAATCVYHVFDLSCQGVTTL
jgi:hypothetical protein